MTAGYSRPSSSGMRVGHAEREAVAAELREHYASGRITLDELNERLDAALAAKTRADLDALMRDLPPARPSAGSGAPGRGPGPLAGAETGWNAGGGRNAGRGAGQAAAAMAWTALMMCALLAFGFLGVFGAGVSRPFGIVLILAGLAFLRRLLFGRRHRARGCGPRRRW